MSGLTKEYRIGQIGYRGRGRGLAKYWDGVQEAKLVAIADLVNENLEAALNDYPEITTYPDHKSMLENSDLDAIVIATAPKFRPPIVNDIAGKIGGIYMEKPISNSLSEADTMIQQCKDGGTILSIGHQSRWSNQWISVRKAVKEGAIGSPTHGWLCFPMGRIFANGTHFFDSLNFILDSKPVEVRGTVDFGRQEEKQGKDPYLLHSVMSFDPGARGFIIYENGARIAVDGQSDVIQPFTYLFCGTRGRIQISIEGDIRIDYRAREHDTRDLRELSPVTSRNLQVGSKQENDNTSGVTVSSDGEAEQNGYRELLKCIETGQEPTSSGEDGRLAMEIIVAFHLSNEDGGRPVSLPLSGPELDYTLRHQG
tara:strand:- start:740 stop:1843 length:1104 start_codon:yes stop_codon:yes gene_type:complete